MATPIATANIVRQAFRFMEVTPPSSLADTSDAASDAKEQYPIALNMCLEKEDFSFARRFAALTRANTPEGASTDPELPYFYPLPDNLVKLRKVTTKMSNGGLMASTCCRTAMAASASGTQKKLPMKRGCLRRFRRPSVTSSLTSWPRRMSDPAPSARI